MDLLLKIPNTLVCYYLNYFQCQIEHLLAVQIIRKENVRPRMHLKFHLSGL